MDGKDVVCVCAECWRRGGGWCGKRARDGLCGIACVWSLESDAGEFICGTEIDSWICKANLWLFGEQERDKLGVWDWDIHTTVYRMDDQWGPTV